LYPPQVTYNIPSCRQPDACTLLSCLDTPNAISSKLWAFTDPEYGADYKGREIKALLMLGLKQWQRYLRETTAMMLGYKGMVGAS